MKKILLYTCLAIAGVTSLTGCKKYLDINNDPDTPQFPDPSSVLPTQLAAIPRGLQFDARYLGRYVQNWLSVNNASAANVNWDRMGYQSGSDVSGDIWRQTYFGLGRNLDYMISQGTKQRQWDYVGVAYALKALMFQYATDYHDEIIYNEAFKDQAFFSFDGQQVVYRGVDSLCRIALYYLGRTDLNPGAANLSKGDYVYNGDVAKWTRFTNGILARNFHRITNKQGLYQPDSVIYYVDRSLANVNDDFLIPFDALKNDDANFFGTFRDNLTVLRQSNFIVRLLDGTTLAGSTAGFNRDPRMKHMLAASHDTTNGNGGYRGVDPGAGDPADPTQVLLPWYQYAPSTLPTSNYVKARQKVAAPWGDTLYTNPARNNFSTSFRKYLFGDKVVFPIMTASELQFTKAEAAFRKGDRATALTAYTNGINLHFDFINRSSFPRGNNQLFTNNPISSAERTAYLNSANVERTAGSLTLQDIMLQKYIALWGWGFFETWVDMRRFHYTDLDENTGTQVYLGFALPSPLAPENLGKPVYRVRPRFNSEYVWNRDELLRIGALNIDYHTYETWFSKP